MIRTPSPAEYAHEALGSRFQHAVSSYDTRRRVEVLVDRFLTQDMVRGKDVLDVGCGLGFFSERLHQRGARVLACDLGPGLVEATRQRVGCDAQVADVLDLVSYVGEERWDLVVSSECIEHTPDPARAVRQMVACLKPSGLLALSTPNIWWQPVVRLSSTLRLRPFDGLENFSSWRGLRRTLFDAHATILREFGIHLFPFQLPFHRISRWCDEHLQRLRGLMINICILAQKEGRA